MRDIAMNCGKTIWNYLWTDAFDDVDYDNGAVAETDGRWDFTGEINMSRWVNQVDQVLTIGITWPTTIQLPLTHILNLTHIHTCAGARAFNGPSSGITWVSRYQKGKKTNLDFTEARDSEWQWHQLGHMQVCTSLQTHKHASTPPLNFYRPDALSATQPTASTNWRHILNIIKNKKYTTMTTKQVDN